MCRCLFLLSLPLSTLLGKILSWSLWNFNYPIAYPRLHETGNFEFVNHFAHTKPSTSYSFLKVNVNRRLFLFVQTTWIIAHTVCRIFLGGYVTYSWYFEIQNLIDTNTCKSVYLCYFFIGINFSMVALMWYWWSLIIKGLLGRGRQNDRQYLAEDQNGKQVGLKKKPPKDQNGTTVTARQQKKEN